MTCPLLCRFPKVGCPRPWGRNSGATSLGSPGRYAVSRAAGRTDVGVLRGFPWSKPDHQLHPPREALFLAVGRGRLPACLLRGSEGSLVSV